MVAGPKFSVVLITKNESTTLPKLVSSLSDYSKRGGEIVVLDTGSTDGTPELARKLGCKVIEVGEKYLHVISEERAKEINRIFGDNEEIVKGGDKYFDFSGARNEVASLAQNDMVCFADADEEFTKLDIDKINECIDQGIEQFEYNFVFSHDQFGNEAIKFVQSKFYDRRKVKWVNLTHEVLSGDARRMLLGEDVFKLEHWQQPGDRHSYLKGLAVDCYLHPQNDRNSHYFARELMWQGRLRSAIKEFNRHLTLGGWRAEQAQSLIYIGDCYGRLGDPDRQVEYYNKAFYMDSSRREPLIKLAWFYLHNKNYLSAVVYTKGAMEIPWMPFYANHMTHYTNEPHEILYKAYGWLGDIPKAQKHLLEALKYQPLNEEYLRDTKFYFEYAYPGIEGWMTYPELRWLHKTGKIYPNILEIGSWKGRSTHALLSGGAHVTAVDHFKGSEDIKDGTHGGDTYEEFMKNVGHFKNLEVLKMSSEEAKKQLGDKKFDVIFIDGGHTYEEVKKDIKLWRKNATNMICGHDYSKRWPEVMRAVNEEFPDDLYVEDTIWYAHP